MDTLSSCYFCGTALDERLQNYPVVPDSLRGGGDVTTATLCPGCHRKLETVLDAVVDGGEATLSAAGAVDSDSGVTDSAGEVTADDDTADAEPDGLGEVDAAEESDDIQSAMEPDVPEDFEAVETGGDADAPMADPVDETESDEDDDGDELTASDVDALAGDIDASILDDDSEDEDEEDDGTEEDGLQAAMEPNMPDDFQTTGDDNPETGDTVDEDTADGDPASEDTADAADDDLTADDVAGLAGDIDASILEDDDEIDTETDESDDLHSAMEPDIPDEFQSGPGSDPSTESDDSGTTPTNPADGVGDDSVEPDEADVGDTAAEPTGDGVEDSGADDHSDARTTVSALEYNKVMRLLQNREFPLDREEIETVAANAYGLSRSECAEVINLAVDRGLIDEDGDQLVRPD